MKHWRIFFLVAGLFNIFGGIMGFLNLESDLTGAGLPAPNYPFFGHLLFVAVIIFGIGYLMVWRNPLAHRGIVWLGLLAKVAGMTMTWLAVSQGQLPAEPFGVQPFFADLPWAVAFALFLWKTRDAGPRTHS
jgi:hypothetical protein